MSKYLTYSTAVFFVQPYKKTVNFIVDTYKGTRKRLLLSGNQGQVMAGKDRHQERRHNKRNSKRNYHGKRQAREHLACQFQKALKHYQRGKNTNGCNC